jgi:hypothetical protein
VAQKDSRRDGAASLNNLKVTKRYLHPDYDIQVQDLVRGSTGWLRIFSLTPKIPGLPSFHARVDDGSVRKTKDPELDIDIDDVSDAVKRDFKAGRNGYMGHHTRRQSNPNERIFDVEITMRNERVFEGEVFFNVNFSMTAEMKSSTQVQVDAQVIRAPAPEQDSE